MTDLHGKIECPKYENLFAGIYPPADVAHRPVRAGQGVLERGSVLAFSSGTAGDKALVLLGTEAKSDEELTAECVLAEDVDTGAEAGAAVTGLVYRTGHFGRNRVVVKEDYTLTAADERALHSNNILLSDIKGL